MRIPRRVRRSDYGRAPGRHAVPAPIACPHRLSPSRSPSPGHQNPGGAWPQLQSQVVCPRGGIKAGSQSCLSPGRRRTRVAVPQRARELLGRQGQAFACFAEEWKTLANGAESLGERCFDHFAEASIGLSFPNSPIGSPLTASPFQWNCSGMKMQRFSCGRMWALTRSRGARDGRPISNTIRFSGLPAVPVSRKLDPFGGVERCDDG